MTGAKQSNAYKNIKKVQVKWACKKQHVNPEYSHEVILDVEITKIRSTSHHLVFIFLDKEYALISRRYQLHPASATTQCPSGHTDARSQKKKKKNYEKEKSRFSEQFLVAAAELTPPR
jgi:hypothetical protein